MLWKTPRGFYIETSNIESIHVSKNYNQRIGGWDVAVYMVVSKNPMYITNNGFDTLEKAHAKMAEICEDINYNIYHFNGCDQ